MPYDRDDIEAKCVEVIKANGIAFFSHLVPFIEPALSTLYDWELEKSETIKKALSINKISRKMTMTNNWEKEDAAPALQIAAFKLLADDDELAKLNTQRQDINAKIQSDPINLIMPDGI
jgi:hypothetical protein